MKIFKRTSGILAYQHSTFRKRHGRPTHAQSQGRSVQATLNLDHNDNTTSHTHMPTKSAGGAHPLSLMQWDRSRPMYDPTTPESLTCMPLSSHGPSCPLHAPEEGATEAEATEEGATEVEAMEGVRWRGGDGGGGDGGGALT